jgi:hypothetical protein
MMQWQRTSLPRVSNGRTNTGDARTWLPCVAFNSQICPPKRVQYTYRLLLEWSRILNRGEGQRDPDFTD